MLVNARNTAFTVSDLLKKNQQKGKIRHRDLTIEQICVIVKNKCFFRSSIFRNQSKTKTILHTVFETIINKNCRFFELKMLEIFARAFFLQNHYWNLNLSIVALSSVRKSSPQKYWKKIAKRMRANSRMRLMDIYKGYIYIYIYQGYIQNFERN